MSKEEDNKAIVGLWFTEFWGKSVNLGVVDEIAAPTCQLALIPRAQVQAGWLAPLRLHGLRETAFHERIGRV
jgi:hypothetical protein